MRLSASVFVLIPVVAVASPTGISGFSGKTSGSTCGSCHTGGAAPTVMLAGPGTLVVGQTGNYTVTVAGGPGTNAGFDAALGGVNSGQAVFTPGAGSKLLNGEVVQSAAKAFAGGNATFTFAVKAPATAGVFTLTVAGLSGNGQTDASGDGTGTASLNVDVTLTAGAPPTTVLPADGGTAAPDAGTVKADAGTTAPTTTSKKNYFAEPRSAGGVDGEAGCSSTGGAPMLIIAAMLLAAMFLRRGPEPLRIRSRRARPKREGHTKS